MNAFLRRLPFHVAAAMALAAAVLLSVCGGGGSADESAVVPTPQGPAGTLDPSFGTGGDVITHVAIHAYPDAIALQSDGKIVVSGYASDNTRESVLLARYDVGGALDPTFGSAGTVLMPFGPGNARSNGMVVQPDGKIVVIAYDATSCGLIRFLGNGSFDPTFGANGIVQFGQGYCGRLALQKDGKIVVGDGTGHVVRFEPGGRLDASFGNAGTAIPNWAPRNCCDVAVAGDGRIVVAAGTLFGGFSAIGVILVRRLNPDGTADPTCCTDFYGGLHVTYSSVPLAMQSDGKILFTVNPGSEVHRLLADGSIDATFGNSGVATASTASTVRAIALQSNGKILVVGGGNSSLDVTRFNSNGTLDATFGVGGVAKTQYGLSSEGFGVAIQPDGRIVVAGNAYVPPIMLLTARFFGDAMQ